MIVERYRLVNEHTCLIPLLAILLVDSFLFKLENYFYAGYIYFVRMGGFYAVSFSTLLIVFVDRLKSRTIGQISLLFPFIRNFPTSFFYNLASFKPASQALGIQLKPQGE